MSKPVVAIVGKPNVGKSALFNKLIGQRLSIVEDTPGVTRDRIYAESEWRGVPFVLIDTGGIEPVSSEEILVQMRRQAQAAIEHADVILFATDLKTGVTATDYDVGAMLKKSGKNIVLAVNKVDQPGQPPADFYEFYNLGLGEPIAISAIHGLGVGDLLDELFKHFPTNTDEEEDSDVIKVAVIGRPNAGKSSFINRILGQQRVIVSDVPGTTRDAIDTPFEKDGKQYVFIDTAGIRRKSKVEDAIEKYSVLRAYSAVERADVCVIMIDAEKGATEQDAKIAGIAHEAGKASIIVVNKWDLVEKETNTMEHYRKNVLEILSFMQYAPVAFLSAKTGQRVEKIFELVDYVASQNAMRVTTGALNDVINEATMQIQPPSDKGKRLKIYYATQATTKPPTFVVFVNSKELAHFSYIRYLENQIRSTFGLEGTPVRFIIREKGEKD